MSSTLAEGSSPSVFQNYNDDGDLSVIGKSNEPNFFILEGSGNDLVFGGNSGGVIDTGEGNDAIIGGDGIYSLNAGDGHDIVIGGDGRNIIDGGDGSDIIIGGNGTDIIEGGAGSDIMMGGAGDDIFKFQIADFEGNETDFILDFTDGEDIIKIKGADKVDYNQDTGVISINDKDAIFLDPGIELDTSGPDDEGTWELI